MIRLIKRKLNVVLDAEYEIKDKVRKLLSKKLTIENKQYPIIQRNYYYMKSNLKKLRLKMDSEYGDKEEQERLLGKINEVKKKLENIERYLQFSSPEICFYKINKDTDLDTFGIGFLSKVKKILKNRNYAFKTIDPLKEQYPKIIVNNKLFNRKYQLKAVEKFILRKYGIIKLPTGSGKTVISLGAIQTILPYIPDNKKVLFIVEQKDLVLQTKKEYIDKDKNLKNRITIIGNGVYDTTGDIVITTIQSLMAFKKKRIKLFNIFKKQIYFYIVDETDMFTSDKRLKFLRLFDEAMYRLFLSATPKSRFKEERNWRLRELAGSIIYTVTEEELIKQKFLSKQDAVFLKNYNLETKNVRSVFWRDRWKVTYDQMIVNSKARNNLAYRLYVLLRTYKLKAIFVTERKEHAELLGDLFKVPVYTGDNDASERAQAIKYIRTGVKDIIVTTRIFRRGINIPELQVFVNMAGYKNDNMTTQSKGRIGRIADGKDKALYVDFFDFGNEYLENHSIERMKTIESLGIKPKTLYINEFEKYLTNYFNIQ